MSITAFKDLPPAEQDLLSGILYRAGVWIGQAEDVDGEEDDRLEQRALHRILESLAGNRAPDGFLRDAARHTLEQAERWPQWAEESFDILPDIARVRSLLKRVADKKDQERFRVALHEVATGVAEAFGEFNSDEEISEGFLSRVLTRIRDRIEGVEPGAMNVSPAESSALEELETALFGD